MSIISEAQEILKKKKKKDEEIAPTATTTYNYNGSVGSSARGDTLPIVTQNQAQEDIAPVLSNIRNRMTTALPTDYANRPKFEYDKATEKSVAEAILDRTKVTALSHDDQKSLSTYIPMLANKQYGANNWSVLKEVQIVSSMEEGEAKEKRKKNLLKELKSVINDHNWSTLTQPLDDGWDAGDIASIIMEGADRLLTVDEFSADDLYSLLTGETRDADLWDLTLNSARRGYNNSIYGEESFAAMNGEANEKQYYENKLKGREYQYDTDNWFEKAISGGAEMFGQQVRQWTNPDSLTLGVSAAGMAALAGQAGPQALAPEELVTVPGAFLTGIHAGSVKQNLEIEAGHAYNEMLEAGVSEDTAKKIAWAVGAGNAALEFVQLDELTKAYKAVDASGATKTFWKKVLDELVDRGVSVAKETGQEVLQEGTTMAGVNIGSKIDTGDWAYTWGEMMDRAGETALSSALSFGFMNAPAAGRNIASITADHKAQNTLTANEQAVVDKVYQDRLEKAAKVEPKKNGKPTVYESVEAYEAAQQETTRKLSATEKKEIYNEVVNDLKKGYISIDEIESVLGGEIWETYKKMTDEESSLVEQQKALYDEYKELGKKDRPTLEEQSRYHELKVELTDLQKKIDASRNNPERAALKAQLDKDTFEMVKGDKLVESFFEDVRSKRQYQNDVTKYEGKAREVIQKVIDSGQADDSKRSHEFWDFVAELASNRDIDVTPASNEQILEMAKADWEAAGKKWDSKKFDGKTMDAYVNNGKIVINAKSKRALNVLLGHEITHTLEKSGHYKSMQKILLAYAESKGELEGRRKDRAGTHDTVFENDPKIKEKIDMEVTADLAGDYFFTDKDFIQHLLTTDKNIFQKVWDEVKYLAKMATGSEQKRLLERAKREYEKAWNDSKAQKNTADSGAKYSIETLPDGKKYVRADKQVILGNDPDSWSDQVESYINGKIRNGENVSLVAEDGEVLVLTADTAGKISSNKTSYGTTMDDAEFYVKANAGVHIDELAQISVNADPNKKPVKDRGARHGAFAEGGWTYRTAFFQDFDGKYYRLKISAAKGPDGNVVYNIGDIEERSFPKVTGSSAKGGALNGKASSGVSVAQEEPIVKQQFPIRDSDNPDIRFSLSEEADNNYLDAVNNGDTETARKIMEAVAKRRGYTIRAYHGTSRGDRVGNVFLPERATSGPMAFFTDNKGIAENYAKSKQDTSMAYDPDYDSYETQFRIKVLDKDIPLYRAWGFLPFDARRRITQKAGQLRENWDGDYELILDPETNEANGGFQWQLKEARGNAIQALTEQWLNSGTLFNDEGRFLDVLEMAGVTEEFKKVKGMGDLYFKDPSARHEKVYDTFLKIKNPFVTANVDEQFIAGLEAWYEEQDQSKYVRESMESDLWDKNSIDAYDFADRLRRDLENDTTHAWTSIPDSVTDYLKHLGYDGIKDMGGKFTLEGHTVWIPFASSQIKSAETVTYDDAGNVIPITKRFDKKDVDIRHSISNIGDTPKQYGSWNVYAKDIMLDKSGEAPLRTDYSEELTDPRPDDFAPYRDQNEAIAPMGEGYPSANESVGAAPSGFAPISHLQYKYGTIPEGEHPVRDDSLPVSTNGEDRVSRTARTVKGARVTPDEFVDLLDQEVLKGGLSYLPVSNNGVTQEAIDYITEEGWEAARYRWSADVRRGMASAKMSAVGALLLNNAAKAGDKTAWLEILADYRLMGTRAAQATQALRILKTLAPTDTLYMVEKSVEKMVRDLHLEGEVEIDKDLLKAYNAAQTDKQRDAILTEIQKNIAKQLPSTMMEMWTALRYVNMLGNFKTQIRNVLGNVTMMLTNRTKNIIATGLEALVYKASKGNFKRTKSLRVGKDLLRACKADFAEIESLALDGGKYADAATSRLEKGIRDEKRVFKAPNFVKNERTKKIVDTILTPLEKYRQVTTWAMEQGDLLFSKSAYARALAGYLKANGVKNADLSQCDEALLDEARMYAIKEAQEVTFRDHNALTEILTSKLEERSGIAKVVNTATQGIMPFRQTPANVLLRAEEYSPLGFANALVLSLQSAAGKSNLTQKKGLVGEFAKSGQDITGAQLINSFAKSLTGTGLFLAGMILSNLGAAVGGADEDEKEEAFDKLHGKQNFSLKICGVYYTLDWLSPSAIPFFMGVNLMEQVHENGWSAETIKDALMSLTEPMLQMSMLQGLNDTLDDVRYAEIPLLQIGENALFSYAVQGMTNSLLSHLERGFEDKRYTTYVDKNSSVDTDLQKKLGKNSAKIPGWDYNQVPYINAWGEEEENPGALVNLAYNLFSPGYFSKDSTDDVAKELYRLDEVNKEERGVFPKTPEKTATFTDRQGTKYKNYDLSADEYVALAKEQGQTQRRIVEELFRSKEYKALTDEQKVKAVHKAYDYAREYAQIEVLDRGSFSAKWMAGIEGKEAQTIIQRVSEQ